MQAVWAFSTLLLGLALWSMASGGDAGSVGESQRHTSAGADITLRTRTATEFRNAGGPQPRVRTQAIFITSGRERRDMAWDGSPDAALNTSSIRDCPQHRWIMLEHPAQTYATHPFPDLEAQRATAERIATARADVKAGRIKPTPLPPNAAVTTIETIDTGERRELGGITLRHLRQTETTSNPSGKLGEPAVGTRKETRDGWYASLPELHDCGESALTGVEASGYTMLRPVMRMGIDVAPRVEFKGNVPPTLGTPVEEAHTSEYGDGTVTFEKTELVELSRAPVDPKLFEIPAGYREALHTPGGGRDMMQPDTLYNRARAWWQQLRPW